MHLDPMPLVTLATGVFVANFSSPHPFTFDTGEILPACSAERARALMLDEVEEFFGRWPDPRFKTVRLTFAMSAAVDDALRAALDLSLDVLLVPLPVMQAIRDTGHPVKGIARVCRVADRVSKTISSTKFCI